MRTWNENSTWGRTLLAVLLLPLCLIVVVWVAQRESPAPTSAVGLSEAVEIGLRADNRALRDSLAALQTQHNRVIDTCLGGR